MFRTPNGEQLFNVVRCWDMVLLSFHQCCLLTLSQIYEFLFYQSYPTNIVSPLYLFRDLQLRSLQPSRHHILEAHKITFLEIKEIAYILLPFNTRFYFLEILYHTHIVIYFRYVVMPYFVFLCKL